MSILKSSLRITDLEPVSWIVSPYEGVAMQGRLLEEILMRLCPRMKQ